MMTSRLGFGGLVLIFKVAAGLKLPNLSRKGLVGCGIWLYQFLIIAYLFTLCAPYLMEWLSDFNKICMNITLGHDKELIRFCWPWPIFSRSLLDFNCQSWAKKCLCTQYLMNQLADFNQICMDITFGQDKKLNRFWWSWTNFPGHCQS